MPYETIAGLVRHALTTAGGYMSAAGYVKGDDVDGIVGALMVLIGVAWSIAQKQGWVGAR